MKRVGIADDHAMFREGIRQLLARSGEFEVVAEAGTASEALQLVRDHVLDVLVLDLSMPGRSGVDLLRHIKTMYPELPVLVLSMHGEDQYAVRTLAAGASAYLTKGSRSEVLLQALRRLVHGGRYIGDKVADLLAQQVRSPSARAGMQALTDREIQVMQALVDGQSVTAVAQQLHLSVKTVSTHKTNLLRKLNCHTLPDLVRYAMDQSEDLPAAVAEPGEDGQLPSP
jgi:DNA-binding NarL/FixJ family response regulator